MAASVYELMVNFSGTSREKINTYSMLYGFARLISMSSEITKGMVDASGDPETIDRLKEIAEKRSLSTILMRQGLTLLMSARVPECGSMTYKKVLESVQGSDGSVNAADLVEKILEVNPLLADLFKKGRTLDDVSAFRMKLEAGEIPAPTDAGGAGTGTGTGTGPAAPPAGGLSAAGLGDILAALSGGTPQAAPSSSGEGEAPAAPAGGTGETGTPSGTAGMPSSDVMGDILAALTGRGPDQGQTAEEPAPAAAPEEPVSLNTLAIRSRDLYYTLSKKVFGQEVAIRNFAQAYFRAALDAASDAERKAPRATFLFAGPPGVGKTYLAELAAESLGRPILQLNMSEYSADEVLGLIGSDSTYKDSQKGKLTEFVRNNPNCIIIIDEIEKASQKVIQLFLQVMDGGKLQDAYERKDVDFTGATLIFTTNAGRQLYEDNHDTNLSTLDTSVILAALQEEGAFPAAMISRFAAGNVVVFNHLSVRYLLDIVENHFAACAEVLRKKYDCEVTFDEKVSSVFLFSKSASLDARVLSSQGRQFIQGEIYEFARLAVETLDLDQLKKIEFRVAVPEDGPVRELFVNTSHNNVLVVTDDPAASGISGTEDTTFTVVSDAGSVMDLLSENDYQFVLIDPMLGYDAAKANGLSLEDSGSAGIMLIRDILERVPDIQLYVLEANREFRDADRLTLQQMGVRGIVNLTTGKEEDYIRSLNDLAKALYIQKRAGDLASRNRVLRYNTAQKASEDGTEAVIELYDFRLQTAIDAGSRKVIVSEAERPTERFDDVIGASKAKEELRYFMGFLMDSKKFRIKGVRMPKGILLYGPPGTGKTMLARAMAGEAGVTFIAASASDFANPYVGMSEQNIRDLFSRARKYAPAVIFIDEIDAIGKQRTGDSTTHHTEGMLNTLLTEMDGFKVDPAHPVFVVAATNFSLTGGGSVRSGLDSALLRRFDNQILVDLPDEEERAQYLRLKLSKVDNEVTDSAIRNIAARTTGQSLAILQNIFDLAVRNAARKGVALTDQVLIDAVDDYNYGEEHKWGRDYYESVAHHEAGHAYISWLAGDKPSFLTIVSRSNFGGYMQHANSEMTPTYSRKDLIWRIRTSLAGRASEIVFYGEEAGINTGVSSDLENATATALRMICYYGMEEGRLLSLAPEVMLKGPQSEKMLEKAEAMLQREYKETIRLCQEGRDHIERLAARLLEKNQLTGDEIAEILKDVKA